MLVVLKYTNALAIPVLLRSDLATGQPLEPGQALEMMFSLEGGADNQADLVLVCEPAPTSRP